MIIYKDTFTRYLVQNGAITIGSANDTSISYVNNHVLPHHVSINPAQDGSFYITATEDETHYVYLNDKRVKQTKLKVGDVIFSSIPNACANPLVNIVFPLPRSPSRHIIIFSNLRPHYYSTGCNNAGANLRNICQLDK